MTFNSYNDQGSEQVTRRRSFALARVPAGAAVLFLAIGAAACGGSSGSGGLPSAGTGSPAAAVSGFIGNIGTDISTACGYVAPDQQSTCNTAFSKATFTVANPGIGNTYTDGSQAIVVVLTTQACGGVTGSTTVCSSNSNKNEGLPSSDADFQSALSNAFNSTTDTDIGCAEIDGSWYVLLQPETAPANTGTTGASTTSGPTGTTGASTTSGPTGTTGASTTSGPTGTTGDTTTSTS
jgi:hypothetical protein